MHYIDLLRWGMKLDYRYTWIRWAADPHYTDDWETPIHSWVNYKLRR